MKSTSYIHLLKHNRIYRKLFYAEAGSVLGDWFQTIALLGYTYTTTQSGMMLSIVLLSRSLPALLLSPFAGTLVDRIDRKKIMIYSDLVRAFLVIGLIFSIHHIWLIIILNILLSISGIFFSPAKQSVVPTVVSKEELSTANALSSTIWGLFSIIGASLGGLLSASIGHEAAFAINSLSFFLSAYIVSTVKLKSEDMIASKEEDFFTSIKEGYRFVGKTPIILGLMLVGMSWGVVGGVYQVLLPIYGADIFQAGDTGIGILYSIQGIGVIIGGWLVTVFVKNDDNRMKNVFGWAYLVQGLFFVFFALSNNLLVGAFFLLLMRIAGGLIIPLDTTLIQNNTPDDMRGRVFSLHGSIYGSIMQLSIFFTGVLLEWFSPQVIGVIFGSICFIVSFTWLYLLYTKRLSSSYSDLHI